jgi:hypothetical protein
MYMKRDFKFRKAGCALCGADGFNWMDVLNANLIPHLDRKHILKAK